LHHELVAAELVQLAVEIMVFVLVPTEELQELLMDLVVVELVVVELGWQIVRPF